jgi:hypothetical protein
VLSAVLFSWLGWNFAKPPADWGGVSLMVWQSQGYVSIVLLAIILLASTAICSLIVHPDSPHMGLFCALLGMTALSIRGGTVHMLIVHAEQTHTMRETAMAMAMECIMWGCVAILADAFARFFHDRLLANTHWIHRHDPKLGREILTHVAPAGVAMGASLAVSKTLHTDKIKGPIRIPLAIILSGAVAYLLLFVLMQSQMKGQVIMACFVAFLASTICAYMAFPTVPFWAILVTVPLTASVGYFMSRDGVSRYPGHAPYFAMQALPIDYLTAGGAGAILGYYWGFAWAVGSAEE